MEELRALSDDGNFGAWWSSVVACCMLAVIHRTFEWQSPTFESDLWRCSRDSLAKDPSELSEHYPVQKEFGNARSFHSAECC